MLCVLKAPAFYCAFLLALLPRLVLGSVRVNTGNALAASTLQAVAVKLPHGSYTFTNVETGEELLYQPTGNHIYPCKTKGGSPMVVQPHSQANWIRLSFGTKNKCLSSAWGGSANTYATAYVCKVGSSSEMTTLEPTKQWWLAVPIDHTTTSKPVSNNLLLAAQAESIKTRNAAMAATKKAFGTRKLMKRDELEKRASAAQKRKAAQRKAAAKKAAVKKAAAKKAAAKKAAAKKAAAKKAAQKKAAQKKAVAKKAPAAKKGKVIGTYYIIPSDHLIDMQTRALGSSVVTSRGIKSTALTAWKKGNKMQQWILTQA